MPSHYTAVQVKMYYSTCKYNILPTEVFDVYKKIWHDVAWRHLKGILTHVPISALLWLGIGLLI